MTGIEFLEKMNDIDSDLLAAADKMPEKKKVKWQLYISLAAAVILAVGLGFMLSQTGSKTAEYQNTLVAFYYDDIKYEMPGLNDYVNLGLTSKAGDSRSAISVEQIGKKDLGEKLGQIQISTEDGNLTCNIYRHQAFPDNDKICIIEFSEGDYQMYIAKE